jgi:hypothetical protein
MKKSILITLLLIPFLGFAQTTKPIEGFLGIKFGSSKADVVAAMKAKGGVLSTGSSDTRLIFTNVKLGQRMPDWITVYLFNDKSYEAVFYFKPEHEAQTIDNYNSLVSDINGVYGAGSPYKSFKSPYKDGDGYEITALSTGNATIFTNWGSDKGNMIQAVIDTIKNDLYVKLIYIDVVVQTQAANAQKEKEKSDY